MPIPRATVDHIEQDSETGLYQYLIQCETCHDEMVILDGHVTDGTKTCQCSTEWEIRRSEAVTESQYSALVIHALPAMVHMNATSGSNMNINGVPTFDTATREDAGWAHSAATVTYTGSPDRVYLNINLHGVLDNATSGARVAPVLELSRGGNLLDVAATGYIRDSNDHEESTLSITFTDPTPGTDPSYSMVLRRDSTNTANLPVSIGYFQAEAVL